MFRTVAIILTFASLLFAASPESPEERAFRQKYCGPALEAFLKSQRALFAEGAYEPHVFRALEAALLARQSHGGPVPIRRAAKDAEFEAQWPKTNPISVADYGSEASPIPAREVKVGTRIAGYDISSGGKDYFFRPIRRTSTELDQLEVRKRYAADRVNELLGIEASSKSWWGTLNGQLGLVSERVYGEKNEGRHEGKLIAKLLKEGKLDGRSLSEAMAFTFLILDPDGTIQNARVDEEKKIKTFDHNMAFNNIFPNNDGESRKISALGRTLPQKYTRRFIEGIERLTPEVVIRELGDYLTVNERDSLLFQREVILQDIRLRGAQAVFP